MGKSIRSEFAAGKDMSSLMANEDLRKPTFADTMSNGSNNQHTLPYALHVKSGVATSSRPAEYTDAVEPEGSLASISGNAGPQLYSNSYFSRQPGSVASMSFPSKEEHTGEAEVRRGRFDSSSG